MPTTKKTEGASKAKSGHATYQDMIHDAIVQLKDRNGSSRQSLKKYVKANNKLGGTSDNMFDSLFNKALKAGVEKGVFQQPKGPSGGTKLAKKAKAEPKKAEATTKKPAAKKAATTKKATTAKTGEKKAAPKKAATAKKPVAKKAEKPETVLTKTKSGRVAKVQKPAATKKAAPKKAAASKKAAATKA